MLSCLFVQNVYILFLYIFLNNTPRSSISLSCVYKTLLLLMVSHSLFLVAFGYCCCCCTFFYFLNIFLWFISNHAFRFVCKHTQADCQTKWDPYHAFF